MILDRQRHVEYPYFVFLPVLITTENSFDLGPPEEMAVAADSSSKHHPDMLTK